MKLHPVSLAVLRLRRHWDCSGVSESVSWSLIQAQLFFWFHHASIFSCFGSDSFLLCFPLFPGPMLDKTWSDRCANLSRAVERLSVFGDKNAVILLQVSFTAPTVLHLLCYSSSVDHSQLATFDDVLRSALNQISNSDLADAQWLHTSLPNRGWWSGGQMCCFACASRFFGICYSVQITEQLLLSPMQARSFFGSYWKVSEWRPKRRLQMNRRYSDKKGGQEIKSQISEYWCTKHSSTNKHSTCTLWTSRKRSTLSPMISSGWLWWTRDIIYTWLTCWPNYCIQETAR